jgi:hypothetical protein
MTPRMKVAHGTTAWFSMAGSLMCEAASRAALSPALNVSLVERYTNGIELSDGRVQGLRFDIIGGKPSFRVGACHDEVADITVEISAEASRALNSLYGTDPNFGLAFARFQSTGELRIDGDFARLGAWFNSVHDPIVERTAKSLSQ